MQFDTSLFMPVVHQAVERVRADWRRFLLLLIAATAIGIGCDICAELAPSAIIFYQLVTSLFTLAIQALGTWFIIEGADIALAGGRQWRIASLFGVSLLTGLGIIFGLLLLILPGLFFAGRWLLAIPILLGENLSVTDAIGESWDRTEQLWLSCTLVVILCLLLQLVPLSAGLLLLPTGEGLHWAMLLGVNLVSQAGLLFGIAAAATMYLTICAPHKRVVEIFS